MWSRSHHLKDPITKGKWETQVGGGEENKQQTYYDKKKDQFHKGGEEVQLHCSRKGELCRLLAQRISSRTCRERGYELSTGKSGIHGGRGLVFSSIPRRDKMAEDSCL